MMTALKRFLFYFLLPIIAYLSFPPAMLFGGTSNAIYFLIGVAVIFFGVLAFLLEKGRSTVLTLCIFLQGLNVIMRLMMLFPNAYDNALGVYDLPYIFTNLLGLGISLYLVLRLDRSDVRVLMVS